MASPVLDAGTVDAGFNKDPSHEQSEHDVENRGRAAGFDVSSVVAVRLFSELALVQASKHTHTRHMKTNFKRNVVNALIFLGVCDLGWGEG